MRWIICLAFVALSGILHAQDVNEKNETAMKEAVAKVAASIVKIETSGGREMASGGGTRPRPGMPAPGGGGVRKGVGPTTGLVVGADGYILTSAFNFANNPSDIFVTVPGQPRLVAKVVANDMTRFLTLLKVDAKNLPVPAAFPKKDVQIGQWSLALGRTLAPEMTDPPSASAGIISATERMYGKALQTDAKVSPVNYGGPLVAIDGRVFGVLVPASPRGEGETAGVEWYDSGIGFAIPLEDCLAVLPRLKEGKDLRRGILGITPKTQDQYLEEPVIGTVSPDSAAQKVGLAPGDKVLKLDGRPTPNFFAIQTILGPKYEGDKVDLVVVREGKEIEHKGVVLTGAVTSFNPGFLGILPMRDDPDAGVEVRYVYAESPADKAGIKAGDRIVKASGVPPQGVVAAPVQPLKNRDQLLALVSSVPAGTELIVEYKQKDGGKIVKKTVKLVPLPEAVPDVLNVPASKEKAAEPKKEEPKKEEKKDEDKKDDEKKEIETGLLKRKNAVLGREYWLYVPKNYKPNVSYGVIVWLHDTGKAGKDAEEIVKIWDTFLEQKNYLMLGPKSTSETGWVASETEGVLTDLKEVIGSYTVDRARIATHGQGTGGQMAAYLGFNARDSVRAVAMTGAALGTAPKDNLPGSRLSFFIVAGDKLPDFKEIEASPKLLAEKKFPTVWRPIADFGKSYMDQKTLSELAAWMDCLDRI